MRWLLPLACMLACEPAMQEVPVTAPPTMEALAWLDAQNAVRQNARPVPSPPLTPLTWSADAAAVALAWAQNCTYQHNQNRGLRGENIAANGPSGSWSLQGVVDAWAGEAADYDLANNSCASGKECGHYTQLVWRDTTRAGCAHATCNRNSPFAGISTWDFWVCDYEPPGNVVGQKPY
ncbi:MAG: CAP domain-containing protein [Myxococcales bacterium]|nr:CAP domain-containing protein [Myxococcales bacterium]